MGDIKNHNERQLGVVEQMMRWLEQWRSKRREESHK